MTLKTNPVDLAPKRDANPAVSGDNGRRFRNATIIHDSLLILLALILVAACSAPSARRGAGNASQSDWDSLLRRINNEDSSVSILDVLEFAESSAGSELSKTAIEFARQRWAHDGAIAQRLSPKEFDEANSLNLGKVVSSLSVTIHGASGLFTNDTRLTTTKGTFHQRSWGHTQETFLDDRTIRISLYPKIQCRYTVLFFQGRDGSLILRKFCSFADDCYELK